ncbi:MAG: endonuclease Q family protein [Patescibacteria group bacterium]|nr:endonuclease Q family protein [Patescibacteria group bacterium]MCL5095717.1 endonuclease Q family protein [Patescibacteria group bacterium]
MKFIADLHLHSKYSRAVSQEMTLPQISHWASQKGIGLVATGDWTHPLWLREIKANLEEVTEGFFRLKSNSDSRAADPLFILSTEISSIYSQNGKGHRIHNVVLAPSIETAEKINQELTKRGVNLIADGRPITGIPASDLVKIILSVDEKALIIPAHVWTPWFSLYGSESGFGSIDECFGDMAKYIYAIETGLSSSPEMNWRIGELDTRSILSCSDAHSGPKLGREATIFEISDELGVLSYETIRSAIAPNLEPITHNQARIAYTLEFYPEEGKYHYTGHRACGIKQSPEETKKLGETCPVCGRHLTIGVMHRVEQLATRDLKTEDLTLKTDEFGVKWIGYEERPPYAMLVPLQEILSEAMGGLPASQKIQNEYQKLTNLRHNLSLPGLTGEFGVLLEMPLEEIAKVSGEKVAEGIRRVRSGQIVIDPGYDGVFGTVKIWDKEKSSSAETPEDKEQMSLF